MYKHSGFIFPCGNCDKVMKTPFMASLHTKLCFKTEYIKEKRLLKLKTKISPISAVSEATIKCMFCGELFNDANNFEGHMKGHKTETVTI